MELFQNFGEAADNTSHFSGKPGEEPGIEA
jgi:hypothetical protein